MDESLERIIDESLQEFFTSVNEASFRVYNQTLCPDLWDNYQHLEPRTRVNLLRMAYDFYKKTEFVAPIVDVWLMGSIANYNWTPDSDVDVHIIIDFSKLQMPPETASKVAKSAGAAWNKDHNVTVKGHKVEINIQSVKAKKPYVMGIYSLMKDEWIRKPCLMNLQVNKPLIQEKYSQMKKYVDFAMHSGNREEMKKAKDYLDEFRQYGLDHGGELSTENIVYKILRSKGLVKALKDAITITYDKEMTVTEVGMKDLKQNLPRDPNQYKYMDSGDLELGNLTLDNLAALRAKVARSIAYLRKHPEANPDWMAKELAEFKRISQEIKRRMGYINAPVAEETVSGYTGYDAAEDFHRRREEQLMDLANLLKQSKGKGKVPWKTIPASLLKRVWLQFGKYHRIKENDLDKIADQMLTNIARLRASTEMMGHTAYDVRPELADNGIEFTDEEWEEWMSNYFTNKEGSWMLSDYGLPKLEAIYEQIFDAETPENKLYAVDKALNVVHQRNDLSAMFVEGGQATLNAVSNQGGYVSPEDVQEGFGWGSTKDMKKDPLHIPGERWRIKWYTNRKTPQMKEGDEKFIEDLVEQLLMESPEMKTLKKNKKPLTDEERQTVMNAKAVWHMGKDGGPSPAVWKSVVNGKTWYVSNTHRVYQCKPTLKGAIRAYHTVVKQSA